MNVLDERVLSELKTLMGDEYIAVYSAFIRTADQAIPRLGRAVEFDDSKTIETIVHTLKGSSANIGAKEMSQICSDMLDSVRKSVTDGFSAYFEKLDLEYEKVKASIEKLS